jgi:hypothetical protein
MRSQAFRISAIELRGASSGATLEDSDAQILQMRYATANDPSQRSSTWKSVEVAGEVPQ